MQKLLYSVLVWLCCLCTIDAVAQAPLLADTAMQSGGTLTNLNPTCGCVLSFKAYPVPAITDITVEHNVRTGADLQFIDARGRTLWSGQVPMVQKLSTLAMPAGLYTLRLTVGKQHLHKTISVGR